ncbi:hypothetical protein OESDEN_22369 [Oesophagostomum dentatum]|uniref:Uncharacterized protein n=1 Tax=Oesophagostomum dentatum TaxID=61180 RepID=A0A0B1S2A5_OESDE|nr:hypothetical protein OESDEN_22369 [Oesophagostomum dentatum]
MGRARQMLLHRDLALEGLRVVFWVRTKTCGRPRAGGGTQAALF